jgi:hypothetical protein
LLPADDARVKKSPSRGRDPLFSPYGRGWSSAAETKGIPMAKTAGSKSTVQSLNKNAPARPGMRGTKAAKAGAGPTVGGKGDRDGKGDIRAKKANTSIAKKSASK